MFNHESLVKAIKQVDIVVSAVGHRQVPDQVKIIAAIKEAGNIKVILASALLHSIFKLLKLIFSEKFSVLCQRFLPSEFGNDVDRVHAVEPVKSAFDNKVKVRRAIDAEGIADT